MFFNNFLVNLLNMLINLLLFNFVDKLLYCSTYFIAFFYVIFFCTRNHEGYLDFLHDEILQQIDNHEYDFD